MKRRPLLLFTTKTPLCVYFVVLVWDKSKCQVLSSLCPFVFLPLEVLFSVIVFSLTEWKALSGFVLS